MSSVTIEIIEKRCTGCEECYLACHAEVIEMVDKKAQVKKLEDCLICETCVLICPTNAITLSLN